MVNTLKASACSPSSPCVSLFHKEELDSLQKKPFTFLLDKTLDKGGKWDKNKIYEIKQALGRCEMHNSKIFIFFIIYNKRKISI